MKTRNLMLAALGLTMLAASSCATLKTAAVEQEEIISQIQKEDATSLVPQTAGRWVDANGWDNEAMGDTD
jgi:non-ribosomal peptide synthetase component E (peptide arylation enzyme)